jgi:hypothetical protein
MLGLIDSSAAELVSTPAERGLLYSEAGFHTLASTTDTRPGRKEEKIITGTSAESKCRSGSDSDDGSYWWFQVRSNAACNARQFEQELRQM